MRSLRNLQGTPKAFPISSDEILEGHAARLLLLLLLCGKTDRKTSLPKIEGLTKIAKLDFFVRYPAFFKKVTEGGSPMAEDTAESKMIRHHYGPWDPRYYQILPYLEARGAIKVRKVGTQYQFSLTGAGKELAIKLQRYPSFGDMCRHMAKVKAAMGDKSGSNLKGLIYENFEHEVVRRKFGQEIET